MKKTKLLYSGSEWDVPLIDKIWTAIDKLATELGFTYYQPQIEIITAEQMLDCYSSVAMPVMYNHWSFGKTFLQNERAYSKGIQGLAYEVVINTDPCITYLMETNTATLQTLVLAHAACVDEETECLTDEGWIKISKYNGQKIAQYNEEGEITFKFPIKYIETKTDNFYEIKAQGISQKVTPDHTMIYKIKNRIKKESAENFLNQHLSKTRGHLGKFITHFKKNKHTEYEISENNLRLQVAIKADGSRQGSKYRFHLKKQRKIGRLEYLLQQIGISYTKTDTYGGRVSIRFEYPEVSKEYTWEEYMQWGQIHLEIVGEEVLYWDGDQKNKFSSTIKQSADVIQLVWASLGYGTSIYKHVKEGKKDCYNVTKSPYSERSISRSRGGIPNEIKELSGGKAYCFTTDTGMWVARRENCIFITGNCGHNHFFKNNYLFQKWTDADSIVDYLKYARNYIKSCEERYGEKAVEYLLDSCHALANHGIDKYKKPKPLSAELQKINAKKWQKYREETFNDIWRTTDKPKEKAPEVKEGRLSEENILYFIEKNSPILEEWQREVVRIVRKVSQYFYPQRQTQLLNEGFACYKGDTEFLSQTGWKKIKDYSEGDIVAQYHKNGDISFVPPLDYVHYKNAPLLEIKAEGINQCVTPNHRMVFKSARGHLNIKRADELTETISRRFITSGNLISNSKLKLTDVELRLMVAIIADGTFNSSSNYCQMGFIKSRKIVRIEKLLKEADIEYTKSKWSQGRTGFSFYAPLNSKSFKNWYSASVEQLNLICEEALEWDAHKDRNQYFSTDKDNMDFIQFALAMTNRRGTITYREAKGNRNQLWIVTNVKCNEPTLSGGSIQEVSSDDVYCFRVPTGMLVTRRENVINISGNTFTHHLLMTELHDRGQIDDGAYIEFLQNHTNVVTQRNWNNQYYSGINVYALGFAMLMDIKRMCLNPDEEDKKYFPDICNKNWFEIITDIVANYRDESFILQFLSPKVVRKFKLFSFHMKEGLDHVTVNATHDEDSFLKLRETLASQYDLSRILPQIEIVGADMKSDRTLHIEHRTKNNQRLHYANAKKTVNHIHNLWGFPVELMYTDLDGNILE